MPRFVVWGAVAVLLFSIVVNGLMVVVWWGSGQAVFHAFVVACSAYVLRFRVWPGVR